MVIKETHIPAGQFKAKCLALLDEVNESGQALVITKRGKPVARLVPMDESTADDLLGSVVYEGDIVSPLDEPWEVGS